MDFCSISLVVVEGGFLLAWTPYAIAVVVRISVDAHAFPPLLGTLPAVFAKTSVV